MLDTSRHMDAIHEIDVAGGSAFGRAGRRAGRPQPRRRGPRARVRPRHLDVQPGHDRRDDRQQLLGQPLDRLRHDDRPRRTSSRSCSPTARGPRSGRWARRSAPAARRRTRSRAAIYRELPEILRDHARAIAEDYPKHWRQSGGYRLDRVARRLRPREARHRLRGHAGRDHRGEGGADRAAGARAQFAVGHFEALDEAVAATEDALDLEPAAVEMIDAHDPRALALQARVRADWPSRIEGEPGALLYVTFFGERGRGERIDRLEAAWREHGHGYHTLRAETDAEQAALTKVRKAGLGLLMAASEGARRPAAFVEDTAVAARAAGRLRAARSARSSTATGCEAGCTATPRSAACTCARSSISRGPAASRRWPPSPTRSRRWWRSSTGSTPPSTATAASAARSTRACSATTSTRRSARSRRCSTPTTGSTRA